ncbi:MAG: hypothetical protein OEY64_03245 [Nitrospinota bacterium]|nr:hypothetical protein [Nitrospinota bacterium]
MKRKRRVISTGVIARTLCVTDRRARQIVTEEVSKGNLEAAPRVGNGWYRVFSDSFHSWLETKQAGI